MRDLFAEINGGSGAVSQSGQRDLLAEIEGGAEITFREKPKQPGVIGRLKTTWSDIKANPNLRPGTATMEGMESLGKAGASVGTGLISLIPAVGSMLTPTPESLKEWPKINVGTEINRRLERARNISDITTYQPKDEGAQKIVEPIGKVFGFISEKAKDSRPFYEQEAEKSFKEGKLVKATALKTLADVLELGAEATTLYLFGKAGAKAKALPKTDLYRRLTIKERGLVTQSLDDVVRKTGLSEGEAIRKYPNLFQEALSKRMGKPEAQPGAPRDLFAEMQAERPALPAGQGFELKPKVIKRTGEGTTYNIGRVPEDLTVEYKPILNKAGQPFKTETVANRILQNKGLQSEWEVSPVAGGFAITKMTPERVTQKIQEGFDKSAEEESKAKEELLSKGRKGNAPRDLFEDQRTGAENALTYLQKLGKIRMGEFASKTGTAWDRAHGKRGKDQSRELGAIAEIASENGKYAMDEAADLLNSEGFVSRTGEPWTADALFEEAAYGNLREILHPKKRDAIMDAKIKELDDENFKRFIANHEETNALDAGTVSGYYDFLSERVSKEAGDYETGYIEEGLARILEENGIPAGEYPRALEYYNQQKFRKEIKEVDEAALASLRAGVQSHNIKVAATPDAMPGGKHVTPEIQAYLDATTEAVKKRTTAKPEPITFEEWSNTPEGKVRLAEVKAEQALIAEAKGKTLEEFIEGQGGPIYHGTPYEFTEFKNGKTTFFSPDKSFAEQYGSQKSFESELDANVKVLERQGKLNLFDSKNIEHIKKIEKLLPENIHVLGPMLGFGKDMPKAELIERLQGTFTHNTPKFAKEATQIGEIFHDMSIANEGWWRIKEIKKNSVIAEKTENPNYAKNKNELKVYREEEFPRSGTYKINAEPYWKDFEGDTQLEKAIKEVGFDGYKMTERDKVTYGVFDTSKLFTRAQLTSIWNKAQEGAGKTENTPAGKQYTIPGASEAETFSLVNPTRDMSKWKPISEQQVSKTEDLFAEKKGEKPDGGTKLYDVTSVFNPVEVIENLRGLKNNIKEAMPYLEDLGRNVYEGGKKSFLDWQAAMKSKLGDLWESFKAHMKDVWESVKKIIGNEKGAAGYDINKGRVIKQRELGPKDARRKAPPVFETELQAVKNMPELRQKPLGGWIENPIRTFEELGDNIKELFYRPVKEAEHASKLHLRKIHEKAEAFRKSLPRKSSERIGAYAIAQQKGGAEILGEMGIKEIPKLTPEEMKAYNWMRRGLEILYGKLQDARAAAGKETFGHVENYFTFFQQMSIAEKMGFSPIFARGALLNNVIHRKTTPFRFEKHRVGGLSRVDLDAFAVFNKYTESATTHIHLSPAIAKGREMLLTFKDGDAIWRLADEKPRAAKFVTEWLDHVAGQRKPQLPELIEKGLTKLNKNLAFSILSANLRSALIQPSAIVNTVGEIGPRWTFSGIKSILDNSAMEKSNVLLSRQFDINVTESLSGLAGKLGKVKQVAGNVGMKPLQWLDYQTAKATWHGAYKKAISEGKPDGVARNYADDVVTKTQGSAMPSDLAPIQRTALGRFLSMFQTFVINQWGFLTRDVLGIRNAAITNKAMLKKVTGFIAAATLFNIFYEDVMGIPSPLPAPIKAFTKALEKGENIPSASKEAALEIAQLVPLVGGGLRYGSGILGAGVEYITDVGKKVSSQYTGFKRPTPELVGKGLGIPGTSQAGKMIRIANRGGSPTDMVLGRYPEKRNGLKTPKLKQPKKIKGL